MLTRDKTHEALKDIIGCISSDIPSTVGSDDTCIDIETDARLIILAMKQIHNKFGRKGAIRRGTEFTATPIYEHEIDELKRGGYSVDEMFIIKRALLTQYTPINGKEACEDNDK